MEVWSYQLSIQDQTLSVPPQLSGLLMAIVGMIFGSLYLKKPAGNSLANVS
jgi:hypothetical protein